MVRMSFGVHGELGGTKPSRDSPGLRQVVPVSCSAPDWSTYGQLLSGNRLGTDWIVP